MNTTIHNTLFFSKAKPTPKPVIKVTYRNLLKLSFTCISFECTTPHYPMYKTIYFYLADQTNGTKYCQSKWLPANASETNKLVQGLAQPSTEDRLGLTTG